MTVEAAISRHERVALQFSGGKDSLACLLLLREFWPRLTVYWTNIGRPFPETLALMDWVRARVPRFVEIAGARDAVLAQHGWPTDIVPAANTPFGVMVAGGGLLLQDRYACCYRSMMLPMHSRMIEDGITLIIRGQRNSDRLKSPVRSSAVLDGFEFLFPIEDWSRDDVMAFLEKEGAPIPRFYEIMQDAPDCLDCTAWWDTRAFAYVKKYHPEQHAVNLQRLQAIAEALQAPLVHLDHERNA